uniref:Integrase catalytic domain-containing protein n=1 Tax=Fagus sylvatica TaxID=28930 RepID=A0A2N9GIC0_FAGSY
MPEFPSARGGACYLQWRRFHHQMVDRPERSPKWLPFCCFGAWKPVFWASNRAAALERVNNVAVDAWKNDFGDRGGLAARGGAWELRPELQWRVKARGASNDDDLSGFCRLSDDLSNGYNYSGGGGVLRIGKGALIFIKGILVNGLYLLQGSSIVGATTQWKTLIEKQTSKKIKRFRIDNGLKHCSREFDEFCKNDGIVRHHTVRRTPQHNGVAVRMNKTLLERARCMLSNARLSKDFWAESVNIDCYLVNRSPSTVLEYKTPFEVWSGTPAGYSNFRVFGCPTYAHVNDVKESIEVVKDQGVNKQVELEVEASGEVHDSTSIQPILNEVQDSTDEVEAPQQQQQYNIVTGNNSVKWNVAINEEIENSKVEAPRFKARLVAKGYTQKEDIDFNEVFSLIVKHSSIRVMLSMAALFDLELEQLDVKTTFLHAKNLVEINKLKTQLSGEFEMKDLGATKKILGMEIHRDREAGKLFLSHKSYIEKSKEEKEYMSRVPYVSAVGSMMYAMVCTRPNISQAGINAVRKVATKDNPMDMMTKPRTLSKFKHCLDLVGICSFL